MADMYTIIENLCNERKISIAQMCRDTGLRQSVFSELKHGRTKSLSAKNIVILANYFGVSTDVFTGQPNPGDIFRDIAHTIAVGEIKTPEPKTEQERLDEKVLELLHQHSLDAQSAIIDLLARMAVKPEEK